MFALTVDLNPIATRRDSVSQASVFIELRTHLIKIRDLQFGTLLDGTRIWIFLAQNHFQQRRFTCAVQTDQANFIATQNCCGEILDDHLVAIVLADVFQLGHDFSGAIARRYIQVDLTLLITSCTARHTQCFQTTHTAFITRTTRLHTLADPDFFLGEEFIKLGVFDFFYFQLFSLANLIRAEVTRERQQTTAIKFDDARCDVIQKTTIMGNEQHATFVIAQQTFEPKYRCKVQMVSRLIEQQNIRRTYQRTCQRNALLHTAGQSAHQRILDQIQTIKRCFNLVIQIPRIGRIQLDLNVVHALHQCLVIIAAELTGQRIVFRQQCLHIAHARRHCVIDRHVW